jgi:hypothetical protein
MKYLTQATHVERYIVRVTFNSGETADVNLEPYLVGEIFESLRALDVFAQVTFNPDIDTICWPNGADFSPEFLYKIAFSSHHVA